MTLREVVTELKRRVASFETQSEAAESLGIKSQYLNDILHGRRQPGPTVLRALGLARETHYVRRAK